MEEIWRIRKLGEYKILINNYEIESQSYSLHSDIMFLDDSNHYHFIHYMQNDDGFKVSHRTEGWCVRLFQLAFDVWPKSKGGGSKDKIATVRISELTDNRFTRHMVMFTGTMCDLGYKKHKMPERHQKQKTYTSWGRIAEYLQKVDGKKYEYYTYRYKTLGQMITGDFTNCKKFCLGFYDMAGLKMDGDLWNQYREVMGNLLDERQERGGSSSKESYASNYKRVPKLKENREICDVLGASNDSYREKKKSNGCVIQ